MKQKMISMLACPHCHQPLLLDEQQQRLICENEQFAYPIMNGIPALLPENAVSLKQDNQNQTVKEI